MTCPDRQRTQSYVDGQLGETDTREAQRHIAGCAECQELQAQFADLKRVMRQTARHYRAPETLAKSIREALDTEDQRRGRDARRRSFWFGAAGGAGISALAAGFAFLMLLPPSANSLAEAVSDAHVDALMSGHVIEIASSNHHTVKPWFAGRVPVSPPVTDFAKDGFPLIGGRVGSVAGSPAAVVVYRRGAHKIDLFVWPDRGSRLPATSLRHGYRSEFWRTGDLDFAAVSDTQGTELDRFVQLVKSERE